MAGVAFETAEQIINDAATELGLITSDSSDPFASTDQNIIQLCRLITGVGRDLVKVRQWSHLMKRTTQATTQSDNDYDLPADFDRYINGSGWNQTTDRPLCGPVSPQQWEYLQAIASSPVTETFFRIVENEIQVYPTPGATQNTYAYAYVSSYWVKESGQGSPNTTRVDDDDDVIHFEPRLMVCALKLAFKHAKGMDASAEQQNFDARMAQVAGSDGASPVLRLAPALGTGFISWLNTPDTGAGS